MDFTYLLYLHATTVTHVVWHLSPQTRLWHNDADCVSSEHSNGTKTLSPNQSTQTYRQTYVRMHRRRHIWLPSKQCHFM